MATLRCKDAFAVFDKNGVPHVVRGGELVDENDPIVKGNESSFENDEVFVKRRDSFKERVEQATKAPGEVRKYVRRNVKAQAPTPDSAE